MSEDLTQFNTRIPKSLYKRFREKVEAEEKTLSKVMERLIESYVEEDDSKTLADDINLKERLEQQQTELEKVANLASSKASREEIENWLDDHAEYILGRHLNDLTANWDYYLKQELVRTKGEIQEDNAKLEERIAIALEGVSCLLPERGEELHTPSKMEKVLGWKEGKIAQHLSRKWKGETEITCKINGKTFRAYRRIDDQGKTISGSVKVVFVE